MEGGTIGGRQQRDFPAYFSPSIPRGHVAILPQNGPVDLISK